MDREILFSYSAVVFIFSSLQSLVLVLLFVLEKKLNFSLKWDLDIHVSSGFMPGI